jgi:hypothetical protein
MKFIKILIYSIVVGIMWGLTYYYLRRLPNPNLSLLDKHGNIKKDPLTKIKLEEYYYDATYGGFAIGVSYIVAHVFREVFL